MKLIESDGKRILKNAGIEVPPSFLVQDVAAFPVFLKAQVLQGRRGQRGLVRRCADRETLDIAQRELTEQLQTIPNAGLYCEAEVAHETQWFVAFDIDRERGAIRLTVSEQGGMSVQSGQSFVVEHERDFDSCTLPSGVLQIVKKMWDAFRNHDMLHLEINPLACRADGSCVALDAKIELDDAAAFRHPEWSSFKIVSEIERESSERERAYEALLAEAGHRGTLGRYVELDGDIAMILSGGGASLVAMDALLRAGGRPANYVEMSGNPDPEYVRKASAIVLSKPGIRAVWIAGSFANFTDIQATVNAVLAAMQDLDLHVPVVIRRDGPNAEAAEQDALRWASERGISLRFDRADVDLDTSAKAIVEASRL